MITPSQCRMARAALDFGVRDLAKVANVSPNTIARLERGDSLHARTHLYIQGALEAAGVVFISARAVSASGGAGIRMGGGESRSRMGKLFENIWNLPDLRHAPEAAYSALLDVLDQYLEIVETEGRQPDAWERLDLRG